MFSIFKDAYILQAQEDGFEDSTISLLMTDVIDKGIDIKSYKEFTDLLNYY